MLRLTGILSVVAKSPATMQDRLLPPRCFRDAIAVALPLALTFALSGCAAVSGPVCAAGEERAVSELMYFGMAKPDGVVSASEWDAFLQGSVTPRFAQGFTAWPASGQWRGANGGVVREASYVLSLVYPADERSEAGARAIVNEYKTRFQQEAVLRVRSHVCVSF
ncbi:DUF3574 domain-containing protein [Cupriavidus lacunae]|nr:DUF3574 domain-containing protein [Cupriavidus lacunae]